MSATITFNSYFTLKYSHIVEIHETTSVLDQLVGCSTFDNCIFGIIDFREVHQLAYEKMDFQMHGAFINTLWKMKRRDDTFKLAYVVNDEEAVAWAERIQSSCQLDNCFKRQAIFMDFGQAINWGQDAKAQC
ncbi:MAG: hypothetical protein AB3N64_08815 [Puniceicoccaceae bacterium]